MNIEKNLLITLINSYQTNQDTIDKFTQLIESQPNSYYGKKNNHAHITSSALIFDHAHDYVLLVHHKKFDKWLQPGGHWMDDETIEEIVLHGALREVKEEAYGNEHILIDILNDSNPLDLDIHKAGDHTHYDIAFFVEIDKALPITVTAESKAVEWIKISDILENSYDYDARLVRMIQKGLEIVNKKEKKLKF